MPASFHSFEAYACANGQELAREKLKDKRTSRGQAWFTINNFGVDESSLVK